ncbi:MAG: M67 family metallopeptidase [Bdellovibrionota bacterium]
MRKLRLSKDVEKAIRAHAEKSYPNEGVGLLIGKLAGDDHEVVRAVPIRNVDPKPDFFRWDDAEYLKIDKEARKDGLDIVGLFHSHPDHPAIPSKTDFLFAEPWGDTFAWIIVSVKQGKSDTFRSWTVDPSLGQIGEFREEKIEIA